MSARGAEGDDAKECGSFESLCGLRMPVLLVSSMLIVGLNGPGNPRTPKGNRLASMPLTQSQQPLQGHRDRLACDQQSCQTRPVDPAIAFKTRRTNGECRACGATG